MFCPSALMGCFLSLLFPAWCAQLGYARHIFLTAYLRPLRSYPAEAEFCGRLAMTGIPRRGQPAQKNIDILLTVCYSFYYEVKRHD